MWFVSCHSLSLKFLVGLSRFPFEVHANVVQVSTMMKKIRIGLAKKCKSLSRVQLSRSSSYTSLRSKSTRADIWCDVGDDIVETVYVGSTRKRYVISSKFLKHPLLSALIERSGSRDEEEEKKNEMVIKCEVVLFDHLLWMLQNSDPDLLLDSLDELTHLYHF